MSLEQVRAALEVAADISAPAAHVLLVLAWYSGPDGRRAYPGVATLSRQTHLDARSVQRALRCLESVGLISVQEPAAGKLPTCYALHLPTPGRESPRQNVTPDSVPPLRGDKSAQRGDKSASDPRQAVTQSLRDPSENQEKSAGARATPTGALPAQAPKPAQERTPEQLAIERQTLLDIAAGIRAEQTGNGARRRTTEQLHKPVTLTTAERDAEISRRRRQARELLDAIAAASSTAPK